MPFKILVAGAGAIGGMLSAYLVSCGQPVTLLARGDNAAHIGQHGIRLTTPTQQLIHAYPRVITDPAAAGTQDLLIVATKAFSLPAVLTAIAPAMGANTLVMPIVNGLPWWLGSDATPLESVDPGGSMRRAVSAERLIGASLYAPTRRDDASHWIHSGQSRLIVGSVSGDSTAGDMVAALFAGSPLVVDVADDIRQAVWTKLAANACFNTLCALTGAQQSEVACDPWLGPIARQIMGEIEALAHASGSRMNSGIDTMFGLAREKGHFKPSTLQDLEAGRPLEVAALMEAPLELARHLGVPMPTLATTGAALRLKALRSGLLP